MSKGCKHGREDFMLCEKCEIEQNSSNSALSDGVMPADCFWRHPDFQDFTHWTTKCGEIFDGFKEGGPYDNKMKFCCYCGGKLIEK